jgi:Zn-dependent protease
MADEFDRFTTRTRRVLTLAQSEAQRLNHKYIGTEHVLLGLVLEEGGIATDILQILGVSLPLVRERIAQLIEPGQEVVQEKLRLTAQTKRVIELAVDEARSFGYHYIGTEHLLAGLMREGNGIAYQVLNEMGVNLDKVRAQTRLIPVEKSSAPKLPPLLASRKLFTSISPIFILIVFITAIAGYLTYQRQFNPSLTIFGFVTGGWIISLCLHEFSHAIVAYWGGDEGVVSKGYLTLNPLKYTHPVLSIILPLIYLALGGLGLPGGAVYINPSVIRNNGMRSLASAAGPIATAICAVALLAPFAIITDTNLFNHFEFWAGLAFLASLEVSALILTILPIPGLDGFGVISAFLPDNVLSGMRGFGSYTLVFIFILFSNKTFGEGFWTVVTFSTSVFNLDYYLVYEGFRLFKFWGN